MKKEQIKWIYRMIFFILALINFLESTGLYQLRVGIDYIYYYTNLSNFLVFLWITYEISKKIFKFKTINDEISMKYCITVGIMITFVVYNTMLGDIFSQEYWRLSNVLKHFLLPLLMFLDYLIFTTRGKVVFKDTLKALIFPLAYFIYALIWGLFSHTYPYFFIDVNHLGYLGVFEYAVVITIVIWLFAYLLLLTNKTKKQM